MCGITRKTFCQEEEKKYQETISLIKDSELVLNNHKKKLLFVELFHCRVNVDSRSDKVKSHSEKRNQTADRSYQLLINC